MVDRKWEELPFDCLVEIFVRVGLDSLVEAVSIVCKSWYKTSLSPLCWQSLLFPGDIPLTRKEWYSAFSFPPTGHSHEEFVKFVIERSNGFANEVGFLSSDYMTQEVLDCIVEGCPSLKKLLLPSNDFLCESDDSLCESHVVVSTCKWKDLEALTIGTGFLFEKIITEISIHCKNFVSLSAVDVDIRQSEASAIANLLPNIKLLSLRGSWIERSNLLTIMKGCKNLEQLDVCFCTSFDVDEEILNLSAHISTVNFEGSTLNHSDDYDDYPLNSHDVDFCDYYSD